MTVFNPTEQTALPATLAAFMTDTLGAPASIAALSDGVRSAAVASGVVDLATGTPAEISHRFEVGSQTKMMTAVVVLQLVEAGAIDLDATLYDYLPADRLDGIANADLATLRDVLAMRSGIPNYTEVILPDGTSHDSLMLASIDTGVPVSLDDALDLVVDQPAKFAPGTDHAYSNTDYVLLGLVAEAVTGQSFQDLVTSRIFEPLGMTASTFLSPDPDPLRLHSYIDLGGDLLDVTEVYYDCGGDGSVVSTVADMTTFLRALLVDQVLLSPAALELMSDFSAGSVQEGFAFANGLGAIDDPDLGLLIGFAGGTNGTESATFLHVATGRILSTVVTQTDLPANPVDMVQSLAAYALDDPAWADWIDSLPLVIDGVAAAALELTTGGGHTGLAYAGAALDLPLALTALADRFEFTDGSVWLSGSRAADHLAVAPHSAAWTQDNRLIGLGGADSLAGGKGSDRIEGGTGADVLRGKGGADHLLGGAGADVLRGQAGRDLLKGGAGDDVLAGGAGSDRMTGGAGADRFVFGTETTNGRQDHDVVTDFELGLDTLHLRSTEITAATETNTALRLTLSGDGDTLDLIGLTLDDLAYL